MKEITIIPDVHGRTFWRKAVDNAPGKVVFLGDYLDPYSFEGITHRESTEMLREIISLKRADPERIVLLLGNHDMGYLDRSICNCRTDWKRDAENRLLLEDNLDLFRITHVETLGGTRFLFSHAGVGDRWVERHADLFPDGRFDPERLNDILLDPVLRPDLYAALSETSYFRGGLSDIGSPIWSDVSEYLLTVGEQHLVKGWFHVFGHTLHEGGAIPVGVDGACLDCRMAFRLAEDPLRIETVQAS